MSDKIESIRHSLSHIMAEAVLQFWPKTKMGMGPAIENGFYYDFELPKNFSAEDLVKIEEKMREIVDRPKIIRAPKAPSDPEVAALESELRGKLGTKVKVQKSGEGRKITIEFFSQEELNGFLDKMNKLGI